MALDDEAAAARGKTAVGTSLNIGRAAAGGPSGPPLPGASDSG